MRVVIRNLFSLLYRIFILYEYATILFFHFTVDGHVYIWGILKIVLRGCLGGSSKHPTLDFSEGYDLTAHEFEPRVGLCNDKAEHAWESLSPSFSAPPVLSFSVSQNKLINLKKIVLLMETLQSFHEFPCLLP